tara:strand:- start:1617 stop:2336 length:720 start_codon:yes stop_codon:yes gene_type:complete
MVNILDNIRTELYADGANLDEIKQLSSNDLIKGFTTNPSLMRKSGIDDYEKFSKEVIKIVAPKSISLEVFADELDEMKIQAEKISTWGGNVYVKIPIQNTKKQLTNDLVGFLNKKKIKLNVTAIFTIEQIEGLINKINNETPIIFSIFAGRIADAGIDPITIMKKSVDLCKDYKNVKILWASPREVYNIIQANDCGVHILTATNDILKKTTLFGKDLNQYSLETVEMFYKDALASKYKI